MKKQYDLSVIIPARNEEFLARTVKGVLEAAKGRTEVIVILDGKWANPPLEDHDDVTVIYHPESIGQRAAINEGARISKAKFIMKLDGHSVMDEGFDVKLMADCEYDWTVVPRLYNLHAFNWKCKKCNNEWYQGPTPTECQQPGENRGNNKECDSKDFERIMIWKPRLNRKSDHMRFGPDLKFQYWGTLGKREDQMGEIADTMSLLGACFFMHRKRYWELGGSEESWGSWGQQGTEIACKTWLSGGRMVVNKKTWYSHLFRTQGGDFTFPYPQSGNQISRARKMSKEMFRTNKWDKGVHPLSWLVEKFWPVPGWEQKDLDQLRKDEGC